MRFERVSVALLATVMVVSFAMAVFLTFAPRAAAEFLGTPTGGAALPVDDSPADGR